MMHGNAGWLLCGWLYTVGSCAAVHWQPKSTHGDGLIIPPPQPRVLGASGQHYRTQQPWVIMCVWRRGTAKWQLGPRRCVDMYDVC